MTLLGVDKARFKKPIFPNQHLVVTAKLEKQRNFIMQFSAEIACHSQIVSSCEFLASIAIHD